MKKEEEYKEAEDEEAQKKDLDQINSLTLLR